MIKHNHDTIQQRILMACQKSDRMENPQLIAVIKTQSVEDISELYDLGVRHFAENRVDALLQRQEVFQQSDIVWHLIGTLQTRKVKDIVHRIDYLHALDRLSLIEELNKRLTKPLKCFLQVNVFDEDSKHGFTVEEIPEALNAVQNSQYISVVGLMTMAPLHCAHEELVSGFKQLKQLQESIANKQLQNCPCAYTSMGMSNDFDIATQEGATHLRIGSALFRK